VQSLVAPVASDPNLEVEFGPGLELAQVYGYEPQQRGNGLKIKLDNMNQGLTQVVMMRFKVGPRALDAPDARPSVRIYFSYYDLEQKRWVTKQEEAWLSVKDGGAGDMLRDMEVGKNFTIALLAQAIRDMAAAVEARNFKEAEILINAAIAKTYHRYPHLEDEDVSRTLHIAQKYQESLRKYNQQEQSRKDR
jgi:hypothetical protein